MSRILITGGGGFVGSHLAARALAEGHEVHVTVRPGSDHARLTRLGRELVRHSLDLRDEAALGRCLDDAAPERIVHLAASPRRPERADLGDVADFVRDDLGVLVRLLSLAAALPRPPAAFVRTGSLAEYGCAPVPQAEAAREEPVTAYGAALVAATQIMGAIAPRLPFPVLTARLALVFGPEQSPDYLIPRLVAGCLEGSETVIRRPGDRRDLIHVDDVVDALMQLVDERATGIVNIASGVAPTMREVAEEIVSLTGCAPALVRFEAGAPSGSAYLCCATDKARERFGIRPRTDWREGLAETVDWYRWRRAVTRLGIVAGPRVHPTRGLELVSTGV